MRFSYVHVISNLFLVSSDCTMTWYAVRRPYDISNGLQTSTYVAAIMVEDFAPWISNTTRLSGVPLQMLIYVYTAAAGACSIVPNITGDRPNRACIGKIGLQIILPYKLYSWFKVSMLVNLSSSVL